MKPNALKTKIGKIAVSLLCIESMFLGNTGYYLMAAKKSDMAVESGSDLSKIIIPNDFGKVDESFEGLEDSLVIHIQDVHCNYEAQKNISEILKVLINKNKIELIALEGAHGDFMADKFQVFKNQSVREKVADHFMKTGQLTGSEYLVFSQKVPVILRGVEEKESYMLNHDAFLKPLEFKDDFEKYYDGIKSASEKIKAKIYSSDLIKLDKKSQELEDAKITLVDFCNFLMKMLIDKGIVLKEYKNFARVIKLKHLESQINFENINKEQIGLINAIGPKLSKDEITDIRKVSIDYKNEKLTTEDFFKYLKRLSDAKEIDIARFPNIAFYFNYLQMYSELDLTELMKEKYKLLSLLKEKLFQNDDQRTISEISDNMELLKKLFSLRVSNEEFGIYTKIKDKMVSGWVSDSISSVAKKNGIAVELPPVFKFEDKYAEMDGFYKLAKQRDINLLENTLSFMREEDSNTAVLISGGFHTQGMLEMLRKKDYSYAVISPSITKEHDYNLYIQNMTGNKDVVEKLMSLQLPGESVIPPPLATSDQPFDPARHNLLVHSAILYSIALELAGLIDSNIKLAGKTSLTPEEQSKIFTMFGSNEYIKNISQTLGVPNISVDIANIAVEGGNNGIIVIPIKLFDLQFNAVVVHPQYDLKASPSKLMAQLEQKGLAKREVSDLNITIYFDSASNPDKELIKQDPYIQVLRDNLVSPGAPEFIKNPVFAIQQLTDSGISPIELGPKIIVDPEGIPAPGIQAYPQPGKGDSLVIYNVDGADILGLTDALGNPDFKGFPPAGGLQLNLFTMTEFAPDIKAKPAYPKVKNENSLGKTLFDAGISQSRIASSDRLAVVTSAFDGNVDPGYTSDKFKLVEVPAPPVSTLAEKPDYNSADIADQAIRRIADSQDQVVMAAFSAPDMLGESGDIINAARGLEEIDRQIAKVVEEAQKAGMTILISATHGNIESMLDETGAPIKGRYNTYTSNQVPFIFIDPRDDRLKTNKDVLQTNLSLGSVAPTLLDILGIAKPETMTAPSLFKDFTPMKNNRVLLITIDGLGTSTEIKGNALNLAREQLAQQNKQLNLDKWQIQYPAVDLDASGTSVGLRPDTAGYPRANYFAMGSGLAPADIKLDMVKIDDAIADESFYKNPAFLDAVDNALRNGTKLHILGLVSDAEVDSSIKHLEALLNLAKQKGMKKEDVIIHTITDGLDEAPSAMIDDIKKVMKLIDEIGVGTLATVGGRYWFMNQKQENSKIQKAYNSLIEERIKQDTGKITGVVLLPDDMINNSLGLREALTVVRQQYGSKIKIGVLTPRTQTGMERVLRVNNISDQVDFIIPEQALGTIKPEIGMIDPILGFIRNKYPDITDPLKQVAVITLELEKLGPDAPKKAQVFVQEKPQSENEVFSVANGLFAAVMTVDGHESELANYQGFVEGKPRTLRTISVERNFLDQLNRQRQINQMFETAA